MIRVYSAACSAGVRVDRQRGRIPVAAEPLEQLVQIGQRLGVFVLKAPERLLGDVDAELAIALELALAEPLVGRALMRELGDAPEVLEDVLRLVAGHRRLEVDEVALLGSRAACRAAAAYRRRRSACRARAPRHVHVADLADDAVRLAQPARSRSRIRR